MIVSLRTPEGTVVGVQSQHVIFVQEGEKKGELELTMINNKRILIQGEYHVLANQLNNAR